jgi:hypothetical protein
LAIRHPRPQCRHSRDVFIGDLGVIEKINRVEQELVVNFEERLVEYDFAELEELSLAYVLSIHKSQGSEFPCTRRKKGVCLNFVCLVSLVVTDQDDFGYENP